MADVMVLQGIRQRYGGGDSPVVEVLHGIDLNLTEGGFSALVGPSGSGKSTLLNIIGLLESPSEGGLWLAGEQASGQSDAVRTALRNRYLGFIFQFHHLLPAFNAEENVLMPVLAGVGRVSRDDRAREQLERGRCLCERERRGDRDEEGPRRGGLDRSGAPRRADRRTSGGHQGATWRFGRHPGGQTASSARGSP